MVLWYLEVGATVQGREKVLLYVLAALRSCIVPSPFPGMNPYFEPADHWIDFHTEFLSTFRRSLAPQVGPKYIVQPEEHLYIHDLPPEPRQRLGTADLSLVQPGGGELVQTALGLLEAPAEACPKMADPIAIIP